MTKTRMTLSRQQWILVHSLAGYLAEFNVSKNLILGLQNYLTYYPDGDPNDYLKRLVDLGDAFTGGNEEMVERRRLRQIIQHLSQSVSVGDWPLILGWTARLVAIYRREEQGLQDEKQIKERIQQESAQNLKKLEEPYYG